jgi:hypothetical protein
MAPYLRPNPPISIRTPLSSTAANNYIPTIIKSLQVVQPSNQELKERKLAKKKLRKERKEMNMQVDKEKTRDTKKDA